MHGCSQLYCYCLIIHCCVRCSKGRVASRGWGWGCFPHAMLLSRTVLGGRFIADVGCGACGGKGGFRAVWWMPFSDWTRGPQGRGQVGQKPVFYWRTDKFLSAKAVFWLVKKPAKATLSLVKNKVKNFKYQRGVRARYWFLSFN